MKTLNSPSKTLSSPELYILQILTATDKKTMNESETDENREYRAISGVHRTDWALSSSSRSPTTTAQTLANADEADDDLDEVTRIENLIKETSYLTAVLNAPSGTTTTTTTTTTNSDGIDSNGNNNSDDSGDIFDSVNYAVNQIYSLFSYSVQGSNETVPVRVDEEDDYYVISNAAAEDWANKNEIGITIDERKLEQMLLKKHGVKMKRLPEVNPGDFEKYLRTIRSTYARFVATRAVAKGGGALYADDADDADDDDGTTTTTTNKTITKKKKKKKKKNSNDFYDDDEEQMHRQNQLLSSVPAIFFREDFNLQSREVFEEILPSLVSGDDHSFSNNSGDSKDEDTNIANSAVLAQEQLGQYLDLVESVIMKRVGDRAEAFLDAMMKMKKLYEIVEETKKSVIDLRTNNRRSFRRASHATAKVKEASRRRDNVLRLAETLKEIENIRQTKMDVDVLLESGEYSECLEAINECERSLQKAIATVSRNDDKKGNNNNSINSDNKFSNTTTTTTTTTATIATTTKNNTNVFSCFSHLPKDLELAKRKCTGAITAELCFRARVESNVVDDVLSMIMKGKSNHENNNDSSSSRNYDKDEYDSVCESILPALRGLLRSSSAMPTVDAIQAIFREILRDLKRDVERVCEKVVVVSSSSSSSNRSGSNIGDSASKSKDGENNNNDGNMDNIYLDLQKCSSEKYIQTLDAVSETMSRLHFTRSEIIRDILMFVFSLEFEAGGSDLNNVEIISPHRLGQQQQSPKFSIDVIKREARKDANERFSNESLSNVLLCIREASNSIVDGGSMIFARFLSCRKHVNAKLDAGSFTKITKASYAFIQMAENSNKNNGKRCVALRSQVHSQARLFLNVKHAAELDKLKTLLEQESWSQATVPAHFQELLDRLLLPSGDSTAVAAALMTSKKSSRDDDDENKPLPTKIVAKNTNTEHVATTTALMLIQILNEYSDIVESIPDLSADVARRIAELLGAFNDGTCVLVLGAQAMQGANLRSITAKHLSVAQQSLRLFQSIAPVLKARLSEITPARSISGDNLFENNIASSNNSNDDARRKLSFANLDKVGRDFETHCERIHLKLIDIIRDRLRHHRGNLPQLAKAWENESIEDFDSSKNNEPSKFASGLIKELGTLTKVVRGMFEENDQNNVLGVVALEFDAKLASSLKTVWEERRDFGGTVERHVKTDCDALRECLCGLAGKYDSDLIAKELRELLEIVSESLEKNKANEAKSIAAAKKDDSIKTAVDKKDDDDKGDER